MKHVKNAIKAAVAVWLIQTGLGKLSSAFAQGGKIANALIAIGESAYVSAILTGTATLIGGVISKGGSANTQNFGSKLTSRDPIAPRQIIYGKTRVGGTVVHMETTGTDNYLIHMVVVLSGHSINSLESIRMNDKDLITSTSTINGSTVYTATNTDFTNTENNNNFGSGRLIRYTFQDGTQTAVDGFMNAQLSSMGTSDKFLGCSYVYIQMVFDAEKFGGGIPAISYKVKGKNIYDPRTGANATTDLQRSNPALIIRDYLTDTQYGIKAKSYEINDTTSAGGFASAANTCDQNVTLADGSTTEKRYTANGFTNFSSSGSNVIQGFLSTMAGKMSYVNGKFNIFAGASQTPSLTITDDDLLQEVTVQTNSSTGSLYNTVKPVYVDSTQNYTAADAPVYQDSSFLNADTPSGESTANYIKQMEAQLPYTVTETMAQRIGRIGLKDQRNATSLECLVSLKYMRLQPNDWVYVTNERLGYTQKVFQVVSVDLETTGGDIPVYITRLQLKETSSSVFDFATNDYTTGQSEGSDVGTGTYAVTAPSNLALAQQTNKDGVTTKVDIKASWTNNSSDKVTLTEVAYKLSTDGAYTSDFTVGKGVAVALLPNVVVGKTYNVKARHIDVNGVASSYTSVVNITIAAPTDAPAVPTNLTASTGQAFNILVSWTNSTSADLKATKIYRRTSNTTPTDDTYLVETIYGLNGKVTSTLFGTQDGLTAGTTYYFWVRSVNQSDVHSAFVGSASGNFTNVSAGEIVDGAITTVKLATDAVTNAKIAVDAIQGDVIAAGAIVEAKLGVDAVTNAKIADNAVNTAQIVSSAISAAKIATGAVTNTKLGTDAVTNAKLADNAVQTAQIATDAITTAKIANDAITSDLVAANAITTTKITDDAISTAKIAANAITANEINANAVTADKIIANAITTAKINAGAITTAKINAGAITADTIATNAITAVKIAADAVTADKVAANAIVANNITANAITSDKIIANAITTAKINAGAITADTIATNAITAVKINADAITTDKIAANAITSAKITANAITANEIAANAVTATQIAANAVTAAKINADAVTADKVAANAIVAANIVSGTITATQMAADSIGADQIIANAVTADAIASGTITATEIASNTITGTQINVDTLDVKHFANVSADIISHSGTTVPLAVFSSEFQRGSTNFTTQTSSTGTYLSMTIDEVRNNAQYQAIWTGVYGDCTNGVLEYSVNGGSSYTQAAGGIQNVTFAAGTFRTYVFAYSGTITGLATSGANANKVFWRVRWITKLRSTYQSLYVFIDNTQ